MISIVVVCKNRLAHLQQTLPRMVQQSFTEVVVVDYGCEQGTADWVKGNFPSAKVVSVTDDPLFCLARARNIGASQAAHEILCFVDADVLINMDIGKWVKENLQEQRFYVSGNRRDFELNGFMICTKSHFLAVGGYDEAFSGWGGEDWDMYERLILLGNKPGFLPREALTAIKHDDAIRQLGGSEASGAIKRMHSMAQNGCYRLAKIDIQNITHRALDLASRKQLFGHIQKLHAEALSRQETEFILSIDLPAEPDRNNLIQCQRNISYRVPVAVGLTGQ